MNKNAILTLITILLVTLIVLLVIVNVCEYECGCAGAVEQVRRSECLCAAHSLSAVWVPETQCKSLGLPSKHVYLLNLHNVHPLRDTAIAALNND